MQRPWGSFVKRRNGVLAQQLQHIGTQTGIGAGTGCQHPRMPEARRQDYMNVMALILAQTLSSLLLMDK